MAGEYERNNVEGTQVLLRTLSEIPKAGALPKFVFASTIGVLDRARTDPCTEPLSASSPSYPTSAYGRSKIVAERLVRESDFPFTILRFSWIYGEGMREDSHLAVLHRMVVNNKFGASIDFPGKVSLVWVRDAARMLGAFLVRDWAPGETLMVSDGQPRSFGEIFKALRKERGISTTLIWFPRVVGEGLRIFRRFLPFKIRCLIEDVLVCRDEVSPRIPGFVFTDFSLALPGSFLRHENGAVIVTGAASGMGEVFAKNLAKSGKRVLLFDRDPRVVAIAAEVGGRGFILDYASSNWPKEFLAAISEEKSPICGLIHCAGIGKRGDLSSHSISEIKSIVDCNVTAGMQLSRLVFRDLRATRGFILLVASSVADIPLPGMAVYAASKAAVLSFGMSLWGELRSYGIRVLTICPSGTRTSFQENSGVKVIKDGKSLLSPDEVVSRSLHALENSNAPVLTWPALSSAAIKIVGLFSRRAEIIIWKFLFSLLR